MRYETGGVRRLEDGSWWMHCNNSTPVHGTSLDAAVSSYLRYLSLSSSHHWLFWTSFAQILHSGKEI